MDEFRVVKLVDIITSRGLGAQCSKHASVLLIIIAVMTISEFEPHSRFHSMHAQRLTFPVDFVQITHACTWKCMGNEHNINIIEAITITCCEY